MLAKLATALISPLGTSILLGALALLMAAGGSRRLSFLLGTLAFAWITIWSMPTASLWLRAQVEMRFPREALKELPKADAIIVLGGGIEPPAQKGASPNLQAAADRVWYGAQLYKAGKARLIILSGGSEPGLDLTSEAAAMRVLLLDLGVPSSAMLLEEKSRNTRENAGFTGQMLKERKLKHILLVTSALHMRRAIALFRAQK